MKTITTLIVLFISWQFIIAQGYVIDSIPVLITDTQSVNDNFNIPYYGFFNAVDSIPVFYEKRSSYSDTASIWCRNIRSMSPEKLFLQSGNGIIYGDPSPDNQNILWCESNFQGQYDIYGFQYDNNFNITDTFRLTDDTIIETLIVINTNNEIYWIQKNDSLLIRQTYSINSGIINLLNKDTIDEHCIGTYPSDYQIIYTKYQNDSIYLLANYSTWHDSIADGDINYVNSTSSMSNNYLWQNGDSIYIRRI